MGREKCMGCVGLLLVLGTTGMVFGDTFADPAGGWGYTYTGDSAAVGTGPTAQGSPTPTYGDVYNPDYDPMDALDGTWGHVNGTDHWNGGYTEAGGGVKASGGYLTIADRTTASTGDGDNSNLYFAHDVAGQGGSDAMLSNGVTLRFRTRLSTNATYSAGDGAGIMSSGKGMFGIRSAAVNPDWPQYGEAGYEQVNANYRGQTIGFSLIRASDYPSTVPVAQRIPGLYMNRNYQDTRMNSTWSPPRVLPITAASRDVDLEDSRAIGTNGSLNSTTQRVLAMDDASLTDWHDFWITIVGDTTGTGTHKVTVWLDGVLTGTEFIVNAGAGAGEYPNGEFYTSGPPPASSLWRNYISMSMPTGNRTGAFDVDYFSFKAGAFVPTPEPATMSLLAIGGLALLRRHRRR